jgi:hypothetical protein
MASIVFRTSTPHGLAYDWSTASNWDLGHPPDNNDSVVMASGGANADLYIATDDIPLLTLQSLTLVDPGAVLNVAQGATLLAAGLANDGWLNIGGALLAFQAANSGIINVASGGAYVGINVSGGGELYVQDGGQAMIGALGFGGVSDASHDAQSFQLRGGFLDVEAASLGAATFNFLGSTHSHLELSLASASGLTAANTFAALGAGDQIALEHDSLTGFAYDPGTQMLTLQAGAQSFQLHIASFEGGAGSFVLATDPVTGNSAVQVACFLRGTRFAAAKGEIAIEDIRAGDLLRTASGALRPVRWVGRRRYAGDVAAASDEIRPVLVRQGALGGGLPARDLLVSPHHALLLEGTLIEARLLTNGRSIVPAEVTEDVEYFNIELDSHDVILAEGAAVESFVDDHGSRAMFDNAPEYDAAYDAVHPRGVAAQAYCAPRPKDGFAVEVQRQRLRRLSGQDAAPAARDGLRATLEDYDWSRLRGWAFDPANPDLPVDIDVVVDGVRAASVLANSHRDDLRAAGLGSGRCGFTVDLPIRLDPSVPHVVRLLVAGTQTELPGSPALLDAIPSLAQIDNDLTAALRSVPAGDGEAISFLLGQIGALARARSVLAGVPHAPHWTVARG